MIRCVQKATNCNNQFIVVLGMVTVLLLSVYPFAVVRAEIGGIGSPLQPISSEAKPISTEEIYYGTPISETLPNESSTSSEATFKSAMNAQKDKFSETAHASQPKDAVMIIRFNQKFVYFENPLRKVVDKVTNIKPEARYELQSVIPSEKNSANAGKHEANLQNVITALGRFGVSSDRVTSSTIVSDSVKNQEINIFVR